MVPAQVYADAPPEPAGRFELGAFAGILSSSFSGEDAVNGDFRHTRRLGMTAGVRGRLRIREWISVQPEVLWAMKGTGTEIAGRPSAKLAARYFEIAGLICLDVPVSGRVRPRVLAGPTLGVLSRLELIYVDGTVEERTERAKRVDPGIMAGVGATWDVTRRWRVSLDVRQEWGLRNLDAQVESDLKNTAFFVLLGAGRTL